MRCCKYEKYTNRFSNINDRAIVGCIILSFIAVILNFFFPLGKEINTIILIIGIIVFFFKRRKNFKKKEIYFLILSSIITSILIIYSNVNRPDAGLYHLPYVSFLNENKIIFQYFIKIADFYYMNSAKNMILRIKNETNLKDPLIKKITNTKYRVLLGPFDDIKKLEKSFNKIKKLNFENLEILKDV